MDKRVRGCEGELGEGNRWRAGCAMGETAVTPYFGDLVPYGDPNWYRDYKSPYYNASHYAWRLKVREFVDEHVMPFCHEWDETKTIPKDLFRKAYAAGILPAVVGGQWPTKYAGIPPPEGYDQFHAMIFTDELSRCGSGGVVWGLTGGLGIGLPPILHFASRKLKDRVAPACLRGEKFICLCITEPYAGSDVANLKCTAKLSEDGSHYVVNGEKKWITNGVFADFFTVAVRTGGPGMGGLSLLLIERGMPGVETRQMNCMGVWASGTTYITFEDVKVPVENRIGDENDGFKYIMYNFNNERMGLIFQSNRLGRVCYEEAWNFAYKRKTFGKRLVDHPVIRWKLAEMIRQIEATHAMTENIVYQVKMMPFAESMLRLGGATALLKVQSTKTFEYCAREAAQIMGGASYVRGGQGEKVERLYREVRAYAIPGGSEEIMIDLGLKMAMKEYEDMQKGKDKLLTMSRM